MVANTSLSGREEILRRIATALRDVPTTERSEDVAVPRDYLRHESADHVELFVERVAAYRATVLRVRPIELAEAIGARCAQRGVRRLAVPADLPAAWAPPSVELVAEGNLTTTELGAVDGTLTGCALAVATTGTIVLDGGAGQGSRRLTLVPDHHLCVVETSQVVDDVPAAIRQVAATLRDERRPITLVSGPSATSDIELTRVEGVHGPRTLDVFVVGD